MVEKKPNVRKPPVFVTPRSVGKATNIIEAVEFFNEIKKNAGKFIVFRGHAKHSWKIAPSLMRCVPDISEFENKMIRDAISLYPHDFQQDTSMFDRLVRLQHFGLPTRLMDVTRNPLVALYFAVEEGVEEAEDGGVVICEGSIQDREKYFDSDAVSCIANLANLTKDEKRSIESSTASKISDFNRIHAVDRLYQFIRSEKPHFRKAIKKIDLFKPYCVIPKMNNRRLIAQSGAFIIHGLDRSSSPEYELTMSNRMLTIPSENKAEIRESLNRLGYNNSTMFPEIDKATKEIKRLYSIKASENESL